MNNFKFRVWHKLYKEYYHVVSIKLDDKIVTIYNGNDIGSYHFDEVIIEQYTGLKDKNGKEVYIGDLFKIKYDYSWKKEDYFEVVFSRKLGIILRNSKGRWFKLVDIIKHYEIVGNIHENKELLK